MTHDPNKAPSTSQNKPAVLSADLPATLPLFPLPGALIFAREIMPLNVFEPRYVAMVDAALAGDRMIAMIQPLEDPDEHEAAAQTPALQPKLQPALQKVGCAARIVAFQETDDNRYLISLKGVCRFELGQELPLAEAGYRQAEVDYTRFLADLNPSQDAGKINRKRLLEVVKTWLDRNNMDANWDVIHQTPDETLINYLCMVSPFGIRERQALLEAQSLIDRTDMMIALAEMLLASDDNTDTPVH